VLLVLALTSGCATHPATDRRPIDQTLDAWHTAASQADAAVYFGLLSEDAIFLGTDASERWTKAEFVAYAAPYFAQGRGWTYRPRDRHVQFTADGHLAWIDELLDSDKYGELRGTGVLRRDLSSWRIVHYSMSFPLPNEATPAVIEWLRAQAPEVSP